MNADFVQEEGGAGCISWVFISLLRLGGTWTLFGISSQSTA